MPKLRLQSAAVFLVVFVALLEASTASSVFKKRRLEQRSNDKFPSQLWSAGSKKSSPITYISLPFANWFNNNNRKRDQPAEKRSNPAISNSIADDFFAGFYYNHRKPIKFISNGKPTKVYHLKTTTTTTTTVKPSQDKDDSSVTWLGNFLMNGLPKKLFDFKTPYSPLSWFSHLKDPNFSGQNII